MSSFLTPLELEYIDGKNWKITKEFDYYTNVDELDTIHIPAGFITDFASIPQLFWNIVPPTGTYGKAAVVHDWLYRTPRLAARTDADAVLLEAMKVLGVRFFTRYTIYAAVRLFGWTAYKGGL